MPRGSAATARAVRAVWGAVQCLLSACAVRILRRFFAELGWIVDGSHPIASWRGDEGLRPGCARARPRGTGSGSLGPAVDAAVERTRVLSSLLFPATGGAARGCAHR